MAKKKYPEPKKFVPKHPHKYEGKVANIISRSSWEYKMMQYLDTNSNVISWGSEEVVIWYRKPTDGRPHRYFMDFHATIKTKDGTNKKYLFEVKPASQTRPPKSSSETGTMTKSFINAAILYEINCAKWEAARKVCKEQGWEFVIMTEKELGIVK